MTRPIALSIAGSDPSGGAGIQADLKTFSAIGAYGCAAIAGLTVQNTQGVRTAQAIDAGFVVDQVAAVLDDLPVAATKIGMLTNAETASALAELIKQRRAEFGIVVLDPVMVATSGDRLLSEDAIVVVRDLLVPQADIVTPNLPEAAVLLDQKPATGPAELAAQAKSLLALGAPAALVKGGHLAASEVVDVFASEQEVIELRSPRINTRNTHGTGCTLSSAIAAFAAINNDHGSVSAATVEAAHDYLFEAIQAGADQQLSKNPTTGHGPVDHLVSRCACQ